MKIVAFAYACEPDRGSESGAGWMWGRMLAGIGEAWIITRANNAGPIEAALQDLPEREQLQFVYVDLPAWTRFWKKGQRGVRLYYLLWQVAALIKARRLHRHQKFDVAWHLTLANAWLGSLVPLVGPTFIYGPVGGGVGVPWKLFRALGIRGVLFEFVRTVMRALGRYVNPLARLAWKRALVILVQNPETRAWLPRRHHTRAVVFPHVVLENTDPTSKQQREGPPTALFAGRLLAWKGVALAIAAVQLLPEWRLVICGNGSDEARLKRLARRSRIEDRVDFRGWVPRLEVQRAMGEQADLLLFPSLHDEAGWVIPESLAAGIPVVCLDWGGPPILGGLGVDVKRRTATVEGLAEAIRSAHGKPVPRVPNLADHRDRLVTILRQNGVL